MQTARKRDIPRENFGVLRLRRQVINPDSYAGIMLTNRIDEEGNYNFAYGLDGIFRLFGKEYLTLYNFHEGNDLWLVYNEDINTDRDYDIPRELLTRGRTVLLKYTNTFGI